jgi:hypothetical protein
VIGAFVNLLDLTGLGFVGVEPAETGRPAYHPSVLLKLHVDGYLNRVQSSGWLEREAGCNVELMWLLGRLVPGHKTVADFKKDNGSAIRKVCALCRALPSERSNIPAGSLSAHRRSLPRAGRDPSSAPPNGSASRGPNLLEGSSSAADHSQPQVPAA